HLKASDTQDVAANEENNTRYQHRHGQKFENVHQHGVETAQKRREGAVGSGQPVDDELKYFNIDDEESDVNEQMQQRRDRPLKHLFLPERNEQHVSPSLAGFIPDIVWFAQSYVVAHKGDPAVEEIAGGEQYNDESELFHHALPPQPAGVRSINFRLFCTNCKFI